MAKTRQIVECVPNFSEGRDKAVIKQITDVIEASEGVKLLDVDPGEATNRHQPNGSYVRRRAAVRGRSGFPCR